MIHPIPHIVRWIIVFIIPACIQVFCIAAIVVGLHSIHDLCLSVPVFSTATGCVEPMPTIRTHTCSMLAFTHLVSFLLTDRTFLHETPVTGTRYYGNATRPLRVFCFPFGHGNQHRRNKTRTCWSALHLLADAGYLRFFRIAR
jgi:hypothetical protein